MAVSCLWPGYTKSRTRPDHGHIYLPVPQIDGAPAFNDGKSTIRFPVKLYQIDLPASCVLAGRCAGPSRR
ncbi:hypothetical protein DGN07_12240 [Xanthomonas citri pv. fuscans]|nr:hypothetical protein DGN07_12240 [Xanthomonas citri pv. fuscans]